MIHSKEQTKLAINGGQSKINYQNGSQGPSRRPGTLRQPARARSVDPYEDDPLFQWARSYFREGKWEAALNLTERLLEKYPGDKKLEKFRLLIRQRMPEEPFAYRQHPAYFDVRSHMKRKEWAAALKAANILLGSYPNVEAIQEVCWELHRRVKKQEARTRKLLLGVLVSLTIVLLSLGTVVYSYVRDPAPLAEILIPQAALNYPPHYLFSIHNAEQPVGVGLSPDGDRIYVTEMSGSRMVRIFDRAGTPLGSFTSPKTSASERAPVYVATDSSGRVYVSDRLQHAIFVFTPEGTYIDTLLGPDLTLSEYVERHAGGQLAEGVLAYNLFKNSISIEGPSNVAGTLELANNPLWSPLGIRIGQDDEMVLTDVSKNNNRVFEISLGDQSSSQGWIDFDPATAQYGTSGSGNGEMLFPNSAMADSQGRVYVSDGNNRRISVWDSKGNFQFNFGSGTGPGSLSLPRGLFIDWRDRLYVVDTVAQNIKVYDIADARPIFLFEFGEFGNGDGSFNYPNDITVDRSGRLYITDRENNRIQVWSY